jgi:transposase-like protein
MGKKKYTPEQIVLILRKVEILCGQGKTVAQAVRENGIADMTYYKWRKEYGGMTTSDAKRLKEYEKENSRLKRIVADLTLQNLVLKDVNSKNF